MCIMLTLSEIAPVLEPPSSGMMHRTSDWLQMLARAWHGEAVGRRNGRATPTLVQPNGGTNRTATRDGPVTRAERAK